MAVKFTSHLKVDKKIVSLLSRSTYQKSFSSAIRELVSNAYDADALLVNIDYDDKKFSFIEIKDDGNGMTKTEFEKYLTIAGTKQSTELTRKYKRKRIGQFGVGFLSIFPFCDSLEITTTVENSAEILKATIPTKDYFDIRKKEDSKTNVDDILINGVITVNQSEKLDHYTRIRLINPTRVVRQYFTKPETRKRESIYTWDPQKRFIWELQEDLPISLPKTSPYHSSFQYDEPIGIRVEVNGQPLHRNDYLKLILEEGSITIKDVQCKYIFTTQHKSILPTEARGVKLRVNNVGIGPRTDFLLKRARGYPRLHWIAGELFFSEEIKQHLNISRDAFISNSVTDEIFEFFANKLNSLANEIETIAEAENELASIDNSNKKNAVKPRKEILDKNIKRLESKGFTVVKTSQENKPKVTVDKTRKTIYVPENVFEEVEAIELFGEKYELHYDRWEINELQPACKKIGKRKVLVNQNFPLFKSKTTGSIFKKMFLLILVATEKSDTSQELSDYLNQNMLKEFSDYIK